MATENSDCEQLVLRVRILAETTFGNAEKAHRWLNKPKERFAGRSPAEMLVSDDGARQVEELLIQIQEGYSL